MSWPLGTSGGQLVTQTLDLKIGAIGVKYPRRVLLLFLCGPALLAGCGQEEPIRVYETAATPRPMAMELPPNWRRVPLTRMDPGDVLYKFEAGEGRDKVQVNVSVPGGTPLANINRWRGLVGLPEIRESQLNQELTPLKIDQYVGDYVEMVGPETSADEKSEDAADVPPHVAKKKVREAIYVAMVPVKGRTWFFRLRGPVAAAQKEKAAFKSFVENGVRALALAVREPNSQESADGK